MYINQIIYLNLDKEYKLVTQLGNLGKSYTDYFSRNISFTHKLYIDNIFVKEYSSGWLYDYFLQGFNNIELLTRFQQEDYNTMSISTQYINKLTGNSSSFPIFSFNINEGEVKNTINKLKVYSDVTIKTIKKPVYPYIWRCNPAVIGKISRELKHSEPIDSNPDINIPVKPEWRGGIYALADIWNYIVYYVQLFVYYIVEFFKQSMFLRDISKGFKDFFSSIKDFFVEFGLAVKNFVTMVTQLNLLNSVSGFMSGILENVAIWIENIFILIGTIVTDTVNAFKDFIDNGLDAFPFLATMNEVIMSFISGDWEGLKVAWENFLPELTEVTLNIFLFIPNLFVALITGDFTLLPLMVTTFYKVFKEIYQWITILAFIYLIRFARMILRRDGDGLRVEITTIVNIFNWIVNSIVFVFHWIFELIHAILDVTIPFT